MNSVVEYLGSQNHVEGSKHLVTHEGTSLPRILCRTALKISASYYLSKSAQFKQKFKKVKEEKGHEKVALDFGVEFPFCFFDHSESQ